MRRTLEEEDEEEEEEAARRPLEENHAMGERGR